MNKHNELRKKLDALNFMDRSEASLVVTEILKYIMDSIQPERSKREDMDGPSHIPDRGWPDKNAGCP